MFKLDLRCEICHSKYDSNYYIPKMLQCGHTLCLKCAHKMRTNFIDKCPFDRRPVDFDEDKLVNNLYLLSLIDDSIQKEKLSCNVFLPEDDKLEFKARPVINSPGWKNTIDAFLVGHHMYSTESNGFIYCTNLETGEWWYLYLNQFFGKFFLLTEDKNMYLIDHYGNLFQIFTKNYYLQIGKKSDWKESQFVAVIGNKLFSLEACNKIIETCLNSGKSRELELNVNLEKEFETKEKESEEVCSYLSTAFKNIIFFVSFQGMIIFANKNGEIFYFEAEECKLYSLKFPEIKNVEIYSKAEEFLYFLEKGSKTIKRFSFEPLLNPSKPEIAKDLIIEEYIKCNMDINPIKLVADEEKIAVVDKSGELLIYQFKLQVPRNLKCKFMLRNCHFQNSSVMEDGNLLILDTIRLSLNKLNIINGTEAVIIHSQKFLYNLKFVFNTNNKIYFIDTSGTLHLFSESDKKITQIGYSGICKMISDYAVQKNFLFTIENTSIFKTNLIDGVYTEYKLNIKEYDYFFADNTNLVLIHQDEVKVLNPSDNCSTKLTFKIESFGLHLTAFALFKNYLVYYNSRDKTIEGVSLADLSHKIFVSDFPDLLFFINNNIYLLAILKDGVIYTLYY